MKRKRERLYRNAHNSFGLKKNNCSYNAYLINIDKLR